MSLNPRAACCHVAAAAFAATEAPLLSLSPSSWACSAPAWPAGLSLPTLSGPVCSTDPPHVPWMLRGDTLYQAGSGGLALGTGLAIPSLTRSGPPSEADSAQRSRVQAASLSLCSAISILQVTAGHGLRGSHSCARQRTRATGQWAGSSFTPEASPRHPSSHLLEGSQQAPARAGRKPPLLLRQQEVWVWGSRLTRGPME